MANIELDGVNKKIKVDSGDLTLDVPGDIVLDADGGDVVFADGGTNLLKVTNSSSDVVLQPQVDTKDIVFKQYDGTTVATVEDNGTFNVEANKLAINGTAITSTAAELNIMDGVTSTASELNILDGVTATAAELNIIDGGTSATSTTLADADRVIVNDNGTMKQVAMTDVKTYTGSAYYVQLANVTISDGDSSEDVQNVFSSTYRNYLIVLENIQVGTNSADLQLITMKSDDSTPSEHTYAAKGHYYGSYDNNWQGSNSSNITIMQGQGSGAGKYVSGFVNFFNPNSSTDGVIRFTWHVSSRKHDQSNGNVIGGGAVATNAARTGFKIKCNSGNLSGGRIVVYGITNPS